MALFDICSDLHLDRNVTDIDTTPSAPTLIMAGDIIEVQAFRKKLTIRAKEVLGFLADINNQYKQVLWVFGNHEFYGGSFIHARNNMRDILTAHKLFNIRIIENETAVVDDCILFGSTLWTNFNNGNPLAMIQCESMMNDYRHIHVPVGKGEMPRLLQADDTLLKHTYSTKHIKEFTELVTPYKKILVTHHAPLLQSISPDYRQSSLSNAYASDLSDLLYESGIYVAIHGHIHTRVDYTIGGIRIVTHPRGYFGSEQQATNYKFKQIQI